MSEGLPNFQANSLAGSGFQSFAGFGFSLGGLDPFNPSVLKPNNGLINSDGNTQNQKPKKGKGKIMNKKKGKDLSVSEAGPQEVSDFGANDENSNSMGFNNQITKAPKQIRKQTLQKLQKRSQKSNNLSGRNADMFSSSNRSRFNRGPPKALNSGMFFKTKICPHFIEGNCRRGDSCNYAHSQNELQIVPNLKKTKICQLYQIGKCNMGNACSFAHGDQELRSTPEFFKTSLCHAFMKGSCKAGESCRYAHGESELRSGPFPVNHSMPMKSMNNNDINNPGGFNLSFPQAQPQSESFNPPPSSQICQNYSLPPSNFGFDNMAFQPFINQQPQQPLNATVVHQEPLPEIKFGSFDPSKLGALWNPNSNNMNFYN